MYGVAICLLPFSIAFITWWLYSAQLPSEKTESLVMKLSGTVSQIFPPKPEFTEKSLPNLHGKIYIVTGSNSGVGRELARILYSKDAKVYIAARSKVKANEAIDTIKKSTPRSKGQLVFLHLDLSDLMTIKESAKTFLAQETKLHVLFNNAGVMMVPQGSKTAQGYELHLGVNNIGPFIFTKLLTPILVSTAKVEAPGTVRVIWVSSSGAEFVSPKPGGVPLDNLDYHNDKSPGEKYGISKAGNYLHAVEFAKRYKADGVVSCALNPGNLTSELTRDTGVLFRTFKGLLDYPAIYGAYTELFAGLSPEVTVEKSGQWIVPWGRFMPIRKDLVEATKTKAEGGSEIGLKFWEWNEEQIRPYI